RHRAIVDAHLEGLGLSEHFSSIDANLRSDNPQDWRGAMYACRSLLDNLADHLWQDPRDSYPPLKGKDDKGKTIDMLVTQDKYINRLMAYMNEKSGHREQTKLT